LRLTMKTLKQKTIISYSYSFFFSFSKVKIKEFVD
jgi:hypothetical protein